MPRMSVDKMIDRVVDRQILLEGEMDRLKDLVAQLEAKVDQITQLLDQRYTGGTRTR